MNKNHADFKRMCVLTALISFMSFANVFAQDVPVASDFSKTQTQNSAVYFSRSDFEQGFSFDGGELTAVKIVTLPDSGTLTFKEAGVSEGSEIAAGELSELMYIPIPDTVYETKFLYQAKSGELYSENATVTISFTSSQTGPLRVENSSITTKKNTPIQSKMIGYSETELTHAPEFIIVDAPTKGKTEVTSVTEGTFTYTPFSDQLGDDSFTFKLVMAPYETEEATVHITIEDSPDTTLFQYADLQNHWAAYSAAMLVERNITIGEKIGNRYYYNPDKQLTRGDFVLLITAAVGLDSLPEYSGTKRFADESSIPSYLIEPAYRALEAGIISGIGSGDKIYFGADNTLNRIEALMMVNNAIDPEVESSVELEYADTADIPAWAVQAVKNMEGYGLIRGFDDNTLRPYSLIIKSQGGEIIYQLVKYLDAYPETRSRLSGNFVYSAQPISYNVQKGYMSSIVR